MILQCLGDNLCTWYILKTGPWIPYQTSLNKQLKNFPKQTKSQCHIDVATTAQFISDHQQQAHSTPSEKKTSTRFILCNLWEIIFFSMFLAILFFLVPNMNKLVNEGYVHYVNVLGRMVPIIWYIRMRMNLIAVLSFRKKYDRSLSSWYYVLAVTEPTSQLRVLMSTSTVTKGCSQTTV